MYINTHLLHSSKNTWNVPLLCAFTLLFKLPLVTILKFNLNSASKRLKLQLLRVLILLLLLFWIINVHISYLMLRSELWKFSSLVFSQRRDMKSSSRLQQRRQIGSDWRIQNTLEINYIVHYIYISVTVLTGRKAMRIISELFTCTVRHDRILIDLS